MSDNGYKESTFNIQIKEVLKNASQENEEVLPLMTILL